MGQQACYSNGDKASLSAALLKLLQAPEQREAMGRKAYERTFERGFLWQAKAQKALTLIGRQ